MKLHCVNLASYVYHIIKVFATVYQLKWFVPSYLHTKHLGAKYYFVLAFSLQVVKSTCSYVHSYVHISETIINMLMWLANSFTKIQAVNY